MSKVYFISDAHLGLGTKKEEREKELRLVEFLEHIKKDASQLFIVGDLFDVWFEYRTVIPKGFHRLFTKLEDLTAQGVTVHYLAGNHDYWTRDYFHDALGMNTHHKAFDITVDGKKIFIHHGDGVAARDAGYKILKKVVQSRFAIWLYSWLHPDIGFSIARSTSRSSRHYTATKDYGDKDSMLEYARRKIEEGYDVVVMGHRHQPACREFPGGVYINLGDWITHNTYAEFQDGHISLKHWTSPQ